MTRLLYLAAALLAAVAAQNETQPPKAPVPRREQFRVIYEWNAIDFQWPAPDTRENYLNSSRYIPQNVLVSGINFHGENIFLTLPRMLDGVPATLATIPVQQSDTAPKLKPFPSWEDNKVGDCNALQFVQNIEIDRNGIMWILDNGRVGTLTQNPNAKCPPSIVLIDLKNGKNEMQRIPFPADTVNANTTYLNDLVVDNRDGDYAYITDNSATDPGIIVFRRSDKKSWKVRDSLSMSAAPGATLFRINGTTINLPVNIDGIALGPQFKVDDNTIDRTIYYCPLSSYHLYAVNASVLRNESLAQKGNGALRPFVSDLGTKPSQTDGMKMDSTGVLFFGLIGNSTIAEWNTTAVDFHLGQRTIARDPNYIQWVDRFTFDDHGNVYVVVNRLYNFVKNQVSLNEVNYRILKSHTGSKSYVYAEDLSTQKPHYNGAGVPGLAGSLVLLALSHLLAYYHLYAVNASVLRNESLAQKGNGALRPFVSDLGTKPSQTDGMKMDSTGVLFFGLIGNSTIAEWNTTAVDFHLGQRTIARDPNYIQWVDRFTFDDHGNVYVVVNRLYNFVKNQVSLNEVNYRILKSHTGSKSYVYAEDLSTQKPHYNGAGVPGLAGSLVLLALSHLLA